MPLVFVPELSCFFLHGEASILAELAASAARGSVALIGPSGKRARTRGAYLSLHRSVARLAAVSMSEIDALPGSIAAYALASKLALDLVARERVVPLLSSDGEEVVARWGAALGAPDDAARVAVLASALPPAAHAVPIARRSDDAWAPAALLRAFLDACIDSTLREDGDLAAPSDDGRVEPRWEDRFVRALSTRARRFQLEGFAERSVAADLDAWADPLRGDSERPRTCFRLELPEDGAGPFRLAFVLQVPDDPSVLVAARDALARSPSLERLHRSLRNADEILLAGLSRAARIFPPVARALEEASPERAELDAQEAWSFLGEAGAALAGAGFGVLLPGELTSSGARRLRLRARVGATRASNGSVAGAGLSLPELVQVEWEAALGDDAVSARDLAALAAQKAPLVLHRGEWVLVDPHELAEIRARIGKRSPKSATLSAPAALAAVLGGQATIDGRAVPVVAAGELAGVIERLRSAESRVASIPTALRAELRPYQARGLAWLSTMSALGLGACLADDMGLGKTIQLLAFLLAERERAPRDPRPSLLVAPTSVVGNWEREAARFAPSLEIVRHYGAERATDADALASRRGALVITSYGLLRRDAELLSTIEWSTIALDEAQNVKTADSTTARVARSLRASRRFALTGTPVENRLAELWSILEFASPGLLGSSEAFRRTFAVPIERHGDERAAEQLRRVVGPFVLRRTKSDPKIIQDLPAKNEMKVVCGLTREQASLYKAVVDAELARIEAADGMARRGRVLALLSFLKQVCNHPAQYLGEAVRDPASLAGRSGKLARLGEMLEEAVAAGDRSLVFTQFREMGDRLERYLAATLGVEVVFLHGGTRRAQRDEMVRRFQEDPAGPRIFVLSVKAGGTGLNLTAASHVFHYDRWWNPAVEDQATDRAYRIGQKRAVQVHKLLTAGTLEERIDAMLERKRGLASKIVGAGEQWITELGDRELRELFALSEAAIDDDEVRIAGRKRRRAPDREARA